MRHSRAVPRRTVLVRAGILDLLRIILGNRRPWDGNSGGRREGAAGIPSRRDACAGADDHPRTWRRSGRRGPSGHLEARALRRAGARVADAARNRSDRERVRGRRARQVRRQARQPHSLHPRRERGQTGVTTLKTPRRGGILLAKYPGPQTPLHRVTQRPPGSLPRSPTLSAASSSGRVNCRRPNSLLSASSQGIKSLGYAGRKIFSQVTSACSVRLSAQSCAVRSARAPQASGNPPGSRVHRPQVPAPCGGCGGCTHRSPRRFPTAQSSDGSAPAGPGGSPSPIA